MREKNSGFKKGSGCYECRICGKKTRDTGYGEESVETCRACYEEAGEMNTHLDTHDETVEGCKWCEATS